MYREKAKQTIRIIEEQYGITLEQKDIIMPWTNGNDYQLDDKGEIIVLNLNDKQISDITPLKELTNLTSLGLENNQISDISPLKGLMNLTSLARSHPSSVGMHTRA